jgi:hypothetical protein
MRVKRLVWFFIAIALGIAGGIAYGWLVNPVKYVNTPLYSLREDYKADYVLMVAEAYQNEHDLMTAKDDLVKLQDETPVRLVQQAVITGQELGYSSRDIELLGKLLQDLQSISAPVEATP